MRLYANPWSRAKKWQALAKDASRSDHVSDCQALAHWADDVAWDYIAQDNSSVSAYVAAFGVFVPNDNGMVELAQQIGLSISATNPSSYVWLNDGKVASGFLDQHSDSANAFGSGGNNNDQAHHFAAFFQFGYLTAIAGQSPLGSFAAVGYDAHHSNFGDVYLAWLQPRWAHD